MDGLLEQAKEMQESKKRERLTLPAEKEKPIGLWGQKYLRYLKESKQLVYLNLLTSGRLNA